MKVKEGFVLRKVGRDPVVVTIGAAARDWNGLIRLNDTGAFLWKRLEKGAGREDLITALAREYEVTEEQAGVDVDHFLRTLETAGCLTDMDA